MWYLLRIDYMWCQHKTCMASYNRASRIWYGAMAQHMNMANCKAGWSKRKLNKVTRQRKEVTPTLKTCLIWNKWNVPFSTLTFLHKPAIFSFLTRQRSWTCSRKHNVLLLSRKKLTSQQFPAARDSQLKALQTRFHNIFMKKSRFYQIMYAEILR